MTSQPFDPSPCDYCGVPVGKYHSRAIVRTDISEVHFVCDPCYYEAMKDNQKQEIVL